MYLFFTRCIFSSRFSGQTSQRRDVCFLFTEWISFSRFGSQRARRRRGGAAAPAAGKLPLGWCECERRLFTAWCCEQVVEGLPLDLLAGVFAGALAALTTTRGLALECS